MLRYERDIVAQMEAIAALRAFPSPQTRLALTDTIEREQLFYRVRMSACQCLAKVRIMGVRFSARRTGDRVGVGDWGEVNA